MNLDLERIQQIDELKTLLLSSRPQKIFEAAFVHARSFQGDDEGLFELLSELVSDQPVIINGGDGTGMDPAHKAWPGADEYEKCLKVVGLTNIMRSEPARHTQEEGVMFANLIEKMGWRECAVVNLPQYLPRIMLSFVKELKKRDMSSVKLYPAAPVSLRWRRQVSGTQGRNPAARILQCDEELEKLFTYPISYPEKFVTIPELIEYLLDLNAS